MASKSQMSVANNLLRIIEKEKLINKFDLMDKAQISLDTYNKMSSWFQHRFCEVTPMVEYDRKTKIWKWKEIKIIE